MSEKMALPDALPDALSGGTRTYGGEPIASLSMNNDGLTATMADGSGISLKWNEEIRSWAIRSPAACGTPWRK